jgi:hypothetical protein
VRVWQGVRVKDAAPIFKAPCARAEAYFLLVEKIQMESKKYSDLSVGKAVTSEEEIARKT